jgi:predicted HTH transcriptional regulator
MALPINVGELIENRVVESTRIEYKSDWDPEPIVHSITAFANDIDNSGGGYIVVGIAEQNGMPRIGDFLKELKMVEGRNTGIPLIVNAMKQNGSDLPAFKTDERRSFFRVILPIHPVFVNERVEQLVQTERRKNSRRTKDEIRQLIIVALRQKELSMREIAAQLGYAKLTDTIRTIVKELIENGEAEYSYPEKTNNPNQKIRLK